MDFTNLPAGVVVGPFRNQAFYPGPGSDRLPAGSLVNGCLVTGVNAEGDTVYMETVTGGHRWEPDTLNQLNQRGAYRDLPPAPEKLAPAIARAAARVYYTDPARVAAVRERLVRAIVATPDGEMAARWRDEPERLLYLPIPRETFAVNRWEGAQAARFPREDFYTAAATRGALPDAIRALARLEDDPVLVRPRDAAYWHALAQLACELEQQHYRDWHRGVRPAWAEEA